MNPFYDPTKDRSLISFYTSQKTSTLGSSQNRSQRQERPSSRNSQTPKQKYPFTRQHISSLFRVPVNEEKETSRTEANIFPLLKNHLSGLKQYGYKVEYQQYEFKDQYKFVDKKDVQKDSELYNKRHRLKRITTMRRSIKLRFKCQDCHNNWTSGIGTFILKFYVVPHHERKPNEKGEKPEYDLVRFKAKLYRMACQHCLIWKEGQIWQSQAQAIAKRFCFLVTAVIDKIPPPPFVYPPQFHNSKEPHISELCQACRDGVCPYLKSCNSQDIQILSIKSALEVPEFDFSDDEDKDSQDESKDEKDIKNKQALNTQKQNAFKKRSQEACQTECYEPGKQPMTESKQFQEKESKTKKVKDMRSQKESKNPHPRYVMKEQLQIRTDRKQKGLISLTEDQQIEQISSDMKNLRIIKMLYEQIQKDILTKRFKKPSIKSKKYESWKEGNSFGQLEFL